MSKKIWRGNNLESVRQCLPMSVMPNNATVVPDSACFPVKEAMSFIRAWELGKGDNIGEMYDRYLIAKERMRKKARK